MKKREEREYLMRERDKRIAANIKRLNVRAHSNNWIQIINGHSSQIQILTSTIPTFYNFFQSPVYKCRVTRHH